MSAPRLIPITLYMKPGCHLCEDVADELEALARRWPLEIVAIDITRDLELHRRYWDKIPVVVTGDRTLNAPINSADLRAMVVRAVEQV